MPSDSEVIIASETDGTRHKVIINPSARIKRPKCNHRAPFLMISVLAVGLLLLLIILGATSFETWVSSKSIEDDEDGNAYEVSFLIFLNCLQYPLCSLDVSHSIIQFFIENIEHL